MRLLVLTGLVAAAGAFTAPQIPGFNAQLVKKAATRARGGIFGVSMSSFLPVEPAKGSGNAQAADSPCLQNPIVLMNPITKEVVEVNNHGACVTSYRTPEYDVLFRRPDAPGQRTPLNISDHWGKLTASGQVFDGSKPISGGVPICWPQFGPGDIQQHGFARNLKWECVDVNSEAALGMKQRSWTRTQSRAIFELRDTKETRAMWNHRFKARYNVELANGCLTISLRVKNTDTTSFTMTGALHTYFAVDDLAGLRIEGLQGATYLDKTDGKTKTDGEDALAITGFTERVYSDVGRRIMLSDGNKQVVLKSNDAWPDLAVWNPHGDEKMGYDKFVCVENGAIRTPISLDPGEDWEGKIEIIPYFDGGPAFSAAQ